MTRKPGNSNNFWQELRRRRVYKVLAIYAGAAYIIIEVVNNISEPLHLPIWLATLVILLLAAGFPVTAILSWIFDLTPEGIVKTGPAEEMTGENTELSLKPAKRRRIKISDLIITGLLIVIVVLVWPKIFKSNNLESMVSRDGRISVAVMPFQNMTNDTTWNVWQTGIQNEMIASLTNSDELKVRQTETVNSIIRGQGITSYASMAPSLASSLSRKMDANIVVNGSINKAGNTVRINANLINAKNEEIIKSMQIESPDNEELIFAIIDSLSTQVRNFLVISKIKKESPHNYEYSIPTNSPEAYRYYTYGQKAFFNSDFQTAIDYYSRAMEIDSNFYHAPRMMSVAYYNMGQLDRAREWCLRVLDKREQMDISMNILLGWQHAMLFETPVEEVKYLKQLLELDDLSSPTYYELARIYVALGQFDKAISSMERVFEIYRKWDIKPRWVQDHIMLGYSYHETGQYRKERKLYKKAEKEFPGTYYVPQRQAILALTGEDTTAAWKYIEMCKSIARESFSMSEVELDFALAYIYTEGAYLDRAEECYMEAIALEAENPSCMNNLGWFLVHHDRNIDEGLELLDKALSIRPGSYLYMENKAEALHKLGMHKEALELYEKAWDLRPRYNHSSHLMIEKVRKAAAEKL